jgi:hypothetical protein
MGMEKGSGLNFAAGGNGGSFPIIVVNGSGAELPLAPTTLGEKFLDTDEKKIYTAVPDGYMDNTNTTINCDINYSTGVASNFASGQGGKYASRSSLSGLWVEESGVQKYTVKFKVTALSAMPIFYLLGTKSEGNYSNYYIGFGIGSDNKIYQTIFSYGTGAYTKISETKILDTEIVANSDYVLNITKDGINCIAQLVKDGEILEEKSFETENLTTGTAIGYGFGYIGTGVEYATDMEIYLLDSSGELLVPNTDVTWNSGETLKNNTQYLDTTNGLLYFYKNETLVKVGGGSGLVAENIKEITQSGASIDIALDKNRNYKVAPSQDGAVTITNSSDIVDGKLSYFYLFVDMTGGTYELTWDSKIEWGNTSPTMTAMVMYMFSFQTIDGGKTWVGNQMFSWLPKE